jgi:hypothetical protein
MAYRSVDLPTPFGPAITITGGTRSATAERIDFWFEILKEVRDMKSQEFGLRLPYSTRSNNRTRRQ